MSDFGSERKAKTPTLLGSQSDQSFVKELHEKRQAQAQERAALTRRHHKLRSFLASGGFREGVNGRKPIRNGVLSRGYLYPLHAAVRANDADAIEVLLWAGADRAIVDSDGLTPLALAQRIDKGNSHQNALICLSSGLGR
uniref:Ankyrin repeat domain-containing protein n=1 Tax=Strombidinopsis acuminata TaxID=141414 RepID=A0A7S3U4R3_9SPIT